MLFSALQIQYGTLSDYFTAVRAEVGAVPREFPSLTGDFFTYADRYVHVLECKCVWVGL